MLDLREEENVDFDEFLNGVRTVMLYDNYFDEMESLFKYLDSSKLGKIKKNDLIDSVGKLRIAIDKSSD
jgi:Ca2+-binding EF-hand superfamily protein